MAYDVITPKKLGQGSIAITNTTRYTVPALTRTFVTAITITNTSTTTATSISVYLVPSAGAAGTTNILISNASIPPSGTFDWRGTHVMETGDFIVDIASATGCTIYVSGGEAV